MSAPPETDPVLLVERGRAALDVCDWTGARAAFEAAIDASSGDGAPAESLDGLSLALYWLGEYPRALALRERAFTAYRRRGAARQAVGLAIDLAMMHGLIHGDGALVAGWVGHAQRLLADCGDCTEAGRVELFLACTTDRPAERERLARRAQEVGRRLGVPGLEFSGIAYLGKSRVEQGAFEEGLRLVDEAVVAASSGVVEDPWAQGEIFCAMFHTCELATDVRRAEAWLPAVDAYVERTGELPVMGICRMHLGGLLVSAGRWQDAERELQRALAIYDRTYTGTRYEPLLRLADLRTRQGRVEEARRLLEGYEDHPDATVPRARLALLTGEPEVAVALLDRHLRRRGRGLLQAPVLDLLVAAHLAVGDRASAEAVAAELESLAEGHGSPAVRGSAAMARGRLAADSSADPDDAVVALEDALEAFVTADHAADAASAQLALAEALHGAGRDAVARAEARGAHRRFQRLGAPRGVDAAADLLRRLGDRSGARARPDGDLTARESEVLGLLAEGLSNQTIADRLVISHRTVEHHVSRILAKLGLTNRAEAAAHAVRHGLVPGSPAGSSPRA